jgi:nucleoside-diphosphate-sugar epimerase
MVIGNGMMAKAFFEFINDDSIIVFASGVSNSKETDPAAFERELSMLSHLKGTSSTLIYFSSCSIFDGSLSSSVYVEHKKKMEIFIEKNFGDYWIFRLPNVIGSSNNSNTMVNFFYNALLNNHLFELYRNAFRYFIDVDDVKIVISEIIKRKTLSFGSYNLLFPFPYCVIELTALLETLLNKKGNYVINEKGGELYNVNISEQLLPYIKFNINEPENYIKEIILKYYFHEISSK